MNIIRCRFHRRIKTSIAAAVLLTLIYIIHLVIVTVRESHCSDEESRQIIENLCDDYFQHKVDGKLCDAICTSGKIVYQKCANYRQGKKVLFAKCNGVCEEGLNIMAVIKARTMEGRHFEPLNLQTYQNKSLTAESLKIAEHLIKDYIKINVHESVGTLNDVFKRLWSINFDDFKMNAKYQGAENTALESLWSLINQDEFLFMSIHQDVYFIPQIYGTCGPFYVTEYAPPGETLDLNYFSSNAKKAKWKDRADIALQILDISTSLNIDFHEQLHFCDVKDENFGINSRKKVKILDTDSLFFDSSMIKDLGDPKCTKHEDCDFFDCRGWCNLETLHCVPKRTNNNLQNICEDIFIPRIANLYTGLLYDPPAEISAELKKVLEECAYPNQNIGEIVRTPTPVEVFWKLKNLLTKSKDSTDFFKVFKHL